MGQITPALTENRLFRIPTTVWAAAAGLAGSLVAIFVFKVAIGNVLVYGLIGLMVLGHLFNHGGHGSTAAMLATPGTKGARAQPPAWTARPTPPNRKANIPDTAGVAELDHTFEEKASWTKTATLTQFRKRLPLRNDRR